MTTPKPSRRAVTTLLTAGLLLATTACDGDSGATPSPTAQSSTQPTSPTPSTPPTPTPRPKPPPIPPAATTGLTIASAEAFARFYLSAIDYAAGTGDPRLIRQWADAGCPSCHTLADAYEQQYRRGGSVTGDFQFRLQRVTAVRLIRKDTAAVLVAGRYGRHTDVERVSAAAKVYPGGNATWDLTLAAQGSHWVMFAMVRR